MAKIMCFTIYFWIFEFVFFLLTIRETIKREIILHIYKILQEETVDNSLDIKEKLELEMNIITSDKERELFRRVEHKITNSSIWK